MPFRLAAKDPEPVGQLAQTSQKTSESVGFLLVQRYLLNDAGFRFFSHHAERRRADTLSCLKAPLLPGSDAQKDTFLTMSSSAAKLKENSPKQQSGFC